MSHSEELHSERNASKHCEELCGGRHALLLLLLLLASVLLGAVQE
jgi:hypothetical protein